MKPILLAVTATLAVVAGLYMFNLSGSPSRLLTKDPIEDAWISWKQTHGRLYASQTEESHRKSVFTTNYNHIQTTNANPKFTFTLGLNQFSDLSSKEFVKQYTGLRGVSEQKNVVQLDESVSQSSRDWNYEGAVTGPKNQGQCGSCWSFSSSGAVEGLYKIKTGSLISLSEQQQIDCDTRDKGCDGGLMDYAFRYIALYGIQTEADYPYEERVGPCRYNSAKIVTKLRGYGDVAVDSPSQLVAALSAQPVSVAIAAGLLQSYRGGIFNDWTCGEQLDHGVLATGYGTESGVNYWIVKNSWGATWGEAGFFRMERNAYGVGICGITRSASYPTL